MVEATAPAKIILFGEHAVVYGQPAIAVPLSSLRARATVQVNTPRGQGLRIIAADLNPAQPVEIEMDDEGNALAVTARLVLQDLQTAPPDITIAVHSQIPIASGLGSGAAVSTALARALSAAVNKPIDVARLNALVFEAEKIHHGTPSGIDNTVIVYEQPVYFVRNQPIQTIAIGRPFSLLIANTGRPASTRIAVGDVRKLYEANPESVQAVFESIGALVGQARSAIESGQPAHLGPLMCQNHKLLQQLTVSSPELDTLVAAALDAGALGAKLSGGGRGGNMIALVETETLPTVHAALLEAGAVSVIATSVH